MNINELINQFEEIYSGKPWYGSPISDVLKDITPEEAVKKSSAGGHTIADILYHMITWRYFSIKQFQGDKDYDVKQNDENDWRKMDYNKKNLWKEARAEFDRTHKMLLEELRKNNDNILQKKIPARNYTFFYLLQGLIQHDVYHLGQISLIKSSLKREIK